MKVPFQRWHSVGLLFLRYALAGVFIYAGLMKVHDAASFAASIARFQLAPEALIHPIALGLPLLEIICGIALLIGPGKRQAAFGIAALCTMFLFALLSAGARGIAIECSCFGGSSAEPLWALLLRDVVLLAASSFLYLKLLSRRLPASAENSDELDELNKASRCLH